MSEVVRAFLIGGLICALVQILLDRTKMMPGRVMVLLVVSGTILGSLGLYEPFAEWAGAGAGVPLLGFGNTLWKGVVKSVGEDGFLGIFRGGLTAASAGIAAALIFGYLGALVFQPKMKNNDRSLPVAGDSCACDSRKRKGRGAIRSLFLSICAPGGARF